ncbi:MAG TPA: DUF58 domain-containing protein [Stellaceae bacterium]|nr:DUF58 domain-containing protein [Stellaceae bacterium]
MLNALWLLILTAAGGWAVWAGHPLLTLAVALSALVAASLLLWRRFSLTGVYYARRLAAHRVPFGATVEMTVELINLKPLPLTWLQIEDTVPQRFRIEGGNVRQGRSEFLQIVVAMLPYERVVRHLRVRCTRRGEHEFGPAEIKSGDYLGLLTRYGTVRETERLVVYPKIFPVRLGRLPSNQILGKDAARRIFPSDPLRVVGSRDYAPGDPYRFIDWRATARLGALMVRVFEPSTTPIVDLVLNFRIATFSSGNYQPDELEFAISVAASLAAYALEKRWAVGLRGNGCSGGAPLIVRPSAAPAQLRGILEALARADATPAGPLAPLVARPATGVPGGATLLLVTTLLDAALIGALRDLRRRGTPLLVVLVGTAGAAAGTFDCPIVRVDYDTRWTEREALVLGS